MEVEVCEPKLHLGEMATYPFCTPLVLKDLQVKGQDSHLTFRTPTEMALVAIKENHIDEVVHTDLVTGKERRLVPEDATHRVIGSGNCERDVYHFLKPAQAPHLQLRLGLTVHRGEGTWSSLPHSFEMHPEPGFEEVFFYLLSGSNGKAIQVGRGMWADGCAVDAVWPVSDRTFGAVPMGHHPVVGEPGVQVSYIWGYVARKMEWEKI